MRTRLLCCIAAALAVSCINRVALTPPQERTAYSGVALPFGQAGEIPPEPKVLWAFGAGRPPLPGAAVSPTFARAGVYTIVETIQDKDGQARTARTHVAALLRTLPRALRGDVRAARLLPSPWTKVPLHRELAGKLALGSFFEEVTRTLTDAVGFNVLDPIAAVANGFDPAKGAAFFTVPQDAEALVLAVGALDDAKALGSAKRLLGSSHKILRYAGGAFQLTDSTLPDGTAAVRGPNL